MANITTVSIDRQQKPLVDETQKVLTDRLGFEPTKGNAVLHACRLVIEAAERGELEDAIDVERSSVARGGE